MRVGRVLSDPAFSFLLIALIAGLSMAGCRARSTLEDREAAQSHDATFTALAHQYLEDLYLRQPTVATNLGIHKYDARLEDYSKQSITDQVAALRQFRDRISAIDPATLTASTQLDRVLLFHEVDSKLLTLEVERPWAKDPDMYSSGITSSAYIMIRRTFASPDDRLRALVAREKQMPAALQQARRNLDNPPRIYTQIALEQIGGNRHFFEDAVASAFPEVKDAALREEFTKSNGAVVAALADYQTWLKRDLEKRSNGSFALGEDTYRKKLAANEMIDTPIAVLLKIAELDLKRNQQVFADTAHAINPKATPRQVLDSVESDHPPPDKLLATTQAGLDAIGRFLIDHHIVTVPQAPSVRVQETPPFMRSTTTASMDIPGPFETVATEAYYSMTLPDPALSPREVEAIMAEWNYPLISNVSVHEVWPGHYLQFLYSKKLPSDVRKVFGAATNSEGWAHYCEQMMIDEGFHADDLRYRLSEIQDALLRDARFIVGIQMHTQGMTIPQAEEFFVKEAYQPRPTARAESKRGASDATYGYYTMGKLMILKLRADYKARMGAKYSLQRFHDTFISVGHMPLPLVRKAMIGEIGDLF
jgi:uncharacterized protein (DUF885 family)